ncbi:MAG: flagellar biosynthetic protein FliR [Candidatus Krumholzibacteriota bacterium]|nr:flagellar biosynthetic protein FliR [Candidatus Krumholzibacteriota bacterium]
MLDIIYNPREVIWYLLVLARISAVIFVIPVFGVGFIPRQWKVAFAVMLTMLACFVIKGPSPGIIEMDLLDLLLGVVREVVLGLLVGLTTGFIFYAVMLWGQLIANQMGLGLANIMDPQAGTDISVLSQFYYMLAVVLFLSMNGHHLLLGGMVDSFHYFPVGERVYPLGSIWTFIRLSGKVFVVALQLASSMIVLLLLVSASLGIMARTVPQMNIFIVGFPLKLFVGLFGMVVSVPYIARVLVDLFRKIPADLALVLGAG